MSMDTSLIERLQSLVGYCREMMQMDQDDAGVGTLMIIDEQDVRTMEDAIEALRNAW